MKNAIAIAKKEMNIYFATPIAWVVFTLFVLIGSYFFLQLLNLYELTSLQYMRFNAPEMMNRLNFQDVIFRNLFGNLGVILIFLMPLLTMRLIAEEKNAKTIELLYSAPIKPGDIVFGKFIGALAVVTIALALTLIYPALVQMVAKDAAGVEWRAVLLGYLGLALLTWIIGWAASQAEGAWRDTITYLAATSHLDAFSRGVLEMKDIIYFL